MFRQPLPQHLWALESDSESPCGSVPMPHHAQQQDAKARSFAATVQVSMDIAGHTTGQFFEPNPTNGAEFREALAQFGTGVTVVTTQGPDGPIGITANSFSSVSLDPPLVLWSVSRKSLRFPHFVNADNLAIHVLAHDQTELCWDFSKSEDAFHSHDWHEGECGTPLIDGCLARFECQQYANYDGGDHAIIVSRVSKMAFRKGDPLLFFGGDVGRFSQIQNEI